MTKPHSFVIEPKLHGRVSERLLCNGTQGKAEITKNTRNAFSNEQTAELKPPGSVAEL